VSTPGVVQTLKSPKEKSVRRNIGPTGTGRFKYTFVRWFRTARHRRDTAQDSLKLPRAWIASFLASQRVGNREAKPTHTPRLRHSL